jgi:dihydrofolate reductase
MRKLKLQVQTTVDGFIAGPNGEMDWMTLNWSNDIMEYVKELTNPIDTILLGRKLAEGFIPHWTAALQDPDSAEAAKIFVDTPKVVFSKTLTSSPWARTMIANGDLKEVVTTLKKQNGKDMIAYGGGKFVSSLIKEKLIDELHLFVNPAIIGKGMTIFQDVTEKQNLRLISSKQFECGIMVLTYQPI